MNSKAGKVLCFQGTLKSETTDKHAHEEHQLLVATEGLMLFEDRHHRHVLSGKNAAYIPKGAIHTAQTMSQSQQVMFDSVYFDDVSFEACGVQASTLPKQIVVFETTPLFLASLEKLCREGEGEPTGVLGQTLLRLLYLLLLEQLRSPMRLSLPVTEDPKMAGILAFIEEREGKGVQLVDLEKRFSMSRRTIQRLFLRECGMGFIDYLRLFRTFRAVLMLSSTDESILSIAYEVGYDSLSAFYGTFTSITGQTPRQYREDGQKSL